MKAPNDLSFLPDDYLDRPAPDPAQFALPTEDDSAFDLNVLADANLAPNNRSRPNSRTPGNPGLRGDNNILAYFDVMAHVHHVVELCSAANDGGVECSAIHGTVGADLNVVFNYDLSHLGKKMIMSGGVACISKTG